MRYSCFNPAAGVYRVFEDDATLPVNADLPAPALGPDVNGIGVPAMDAARPLPRGAREAGTSWQPQGIIVRCDGFSGFGAYEEQSSAVKVIAGVVAALAGAYLFARMTR